MQPNRLGLGLRPPLPSYGQGPSISALAQQQQQMHVQGFTPPQAQKQISLFVGSISGGITDGFLNDLLSVGVLPRHRPHFSLMETR
jgi:RNA-binding protein 25